MPDLHQILRHLSIPDSSIKFSQSIARQEARDEDGERDDTYTFTLQCEVSNDLLTEPAKINVKQQMSESEMRMSEMGRDYVWRGLWGKLIASPAFMQSCGVYDGL